MVMEAIGNSSLGNFRVLANAGAARSDETAMSERIDLIILNVRCERQQTPYRASNFFR